MSRAAFLPGDGRPIVAGWSGDLRVCASLDGTGGVKEVSASGDALARGDPIRALASVATIAASPATLTRPWAAALLAVALAAPAGAASEAVAARAIAMYRQDQPCLAAEAMNAVVGARIPSPASAGRAVAEYERAVAERGLDHDALWLICLLHRGVAQGDAGMVAEAIGRGVDVEGHVDPDRTTALIEAAARKQVEIAGALLAAGASASAADVAGWTPLHHAAAGRAPTESDQLRRRQLALTLLERGAAPDAATAVVGWSPLLLAAAAGDLAVVHALLDSGARPNAATRTSGWTPLFLAEREGHEAVAAALRAAGGTRQAASASEPAALHVYGRKVAWAFDGVPVHATLDFDPDGFASGGHVLHAKGDFTATESGERLVLERLGFDPVRGRRLTAAGLVDRDGATQVLWVADDYRQFMGLCRDPSSGLDHVMVREGSGGSCCGPVVEFWRAGPGSKTLRLAYSFEDEDTVGHSDSMAWPDETGQCRWQRRREAEQSLAEVLPTLQVGEGVWVEVGEEVERRLPSARVPEGTVAAALTALADMPAEIATVFRFPDASSSEHGDRPASDRWEVVSVARTGRGADDYHGTDAALLVRDRRDGGWRSIYDCGNVVIEGVQDDSLLVRVPGRYGEREPDASPCAPGFSVSMRIDLETLHLRPQDQRLAP